MTPTAQNVLLWIATWPYYWTLRNYTLDPINRIRDAAVDPTLQAREIVTFLAGKRQELKFINTASTISAAATVGALSWSSINEAPWAALALWYCSLSFAIFALITSNQHSALMDSSLGQTSTSSLSSTTCKDIEKQNTTNFAMSNTSDWHTKHLVYIWQCPIMLMSWSWVTYMIAQTLHIARPLFRQYVGKDDRKVAIAYLSVCCVIVANFVWCSFWFYRMASASKTSCAWQEHSPSSRNTVHDERTSAEGHEDETCSIQEGTTIQVLSFDKE